MSSFSESGCVRCRSHWQTWSDQPEYLGQSDEYQCLLYRCAACGAYWEEPNGAYPGTVTPVEARQRLPWAGVTADGGIDRAWTAELVVIEQLLQHEPGFHRLTPGEAVIRVGDGETEYAVLDDQGEGRFQERQRGAVTKTLPTMSVLVALRRLVHRVAWLTRPGWWPSLGRFDAPPEDAGQVPPEKVAASYLHVAGAPLYRLPAAQPPDEARRVIPLDEPYQRYLARVRRYDREPLELPESGDSLLDGLLGELRLLSWQPAASCLLEVGNDQRHVTLVQEDAGPVRLDTVDRAYAGRSAGSPTGRRRTRTSS